VVRIAAAGATGTGFFVAPGQLLTCAHVIAPASGDLTRVRIEHLGKSYTPRLLKHLPGQFPDLALLSVDLSDHPVVFFDTNLAPGAPLYAFGFTERYPAGEPATVEYEGQAQLAPGSALMKFKGGQIIPGLSGAPLLNLSNWTVAGLVKSTRDRASDLGGGGISTRTILEQLPELAPLQAVVHNFDKRWFTAAQQQREQATDRSARPSVVIEVKQQRTVRRAQEVELSTESVPLSPILERLWCPQSVVWFAPDAIALGSRDSTLRIAFARWPPHS
jgi:hypothetical protein